MGSPPPWECIVGHAELEILNVVKSDAAVLVSSHHPVNETRCLHQFWMDQESTLPKEHPFRNGSAKSLASFCFSLMGGIGVKSYSASQGRKR